MRRSRRQQTRRHRQPKRNPPGTESPESHRLKIAPGSPSDDSASVNADPGTHSTQLVAFTPSPDGPPLLEVSTPQRGINKKKQRVIEKEGTDSDASEEEIIFLTNEDSDSDQGLNNDRLLDMESLSHGSTGTPPTAVPHPLEDTPPRTYAEVTRENLRPVPPAAVNIQKSCRYTAQLLVPADPEPVKKAGELLKAAFEEIQRQAGNQVWIAAWNHEEDQALCKQPQDLPGSTTFKDRDLFTKLFCNYMSISPDTERRVYFKIHFVTQSPGDLTIPLPLLGQNLENLKDMFGFHLTANPIPCQSTRVSTIGWGYGTVKSTNADILASELRKALQIPEYISFGIQWRTIADQHGKKYPWPKDDADPRPPQALHFDMDDAYVAAWQAKFAKLFKKGSRKRVLHLQMRLVPCFTSQLGQTVSDVARKGIVYMAQKQAHLINNHIAKLTNTHILELDHPVGDHYTLRRYLMNKAPAHSVTARVFVSTDKAYRGTDHVLVTPKKYSEQALRILNNMIPECFHLFGPEAARWFTTTGLVAYKDTKWDPVNNVSTSIHDDIVNDLLDEDLWEMGDSWKSMPEPTLETLNTNPANQITISNILDARAQQGVNEETESFGDIYGRSHSGTTIAPNRPSPQAATAGRGNNRRVMFGDTSTEPGNHNRADDGTISTVATEVTTMSTRRTLRDQLAINESLRNEGNQIAQERDQLRAELERLQAQLGNAGIEPISPPRRTARSHIAHAISPHPSVLTGTTNTAADSVGEKT